MKHLNLSSLLVIAVSALLVSCSQDEVVEVSQDHAIGFKAMANKPVNRAAGEVTTNGIERFRVFGCVSDKTTHNNHVQLFNDVIVSKETGTSNWSYSPEQYWATNKEYYFVAISTNVPDKKWGYEMPGTHPSDITVDNFKGSGTVTFDNSLDATSGTRDLVYAYGAVATGDNVNSMGTVNFTFNHMLSHIQILMKNVIKNPDYTIKITNLTVNKTIAKGTVELGAEPSALSWNPESGADGKVTVTSISATMADKQIAANGELTSENRYIIPGEQELSVTFDIEVFYKGITYSSHKLTGTIANMTYNPGYSYRFTTEITEDNVVPGGAKPIIFGVTAVNTWNKWNFNEGEGTVTIQ